MTELVLITGASTGIGLSAAVTCAAKGHRVVATMRDIDKRGPLLDVAKARGLTVDVEQLDVTSEGAGAKVRELTLKYGPFFALVNNAGFVVGGALEEQSEEDLRQLFETNVFGLIAVTRAMLPSMRAAGRGRIINVSSVAGRVGFPMLGAYSASKHAVEGLSESLRWEVEPFGIEVCVVEPGSLSTSLSLGARRRSPGLDAGPAKGPPSPSGLEGDPAKGAPYPSGLEGGPASQRILSPYAALAETLESTVQEEAADEASPDDVGLAIAALIDDPAPKFRTLVGIEARTLVTLRRVVPDRLFASGIRRLLRLRSRGRRVDTPGGGE